MKTIIKFEDNLFFCLHSSKHLIKERLANMGFNYPTFDINVNKDYYRS